MPSQSITNVDVDTTSVPPNNIDKLTDVPFVYNSVGHLEGEPNIVSISIISITITHFNEILQQEIDISFRDVQILDEEWEHRLQY